MHAFAACRLIVRTLRPPRALAACAPRRGLRCARGARGVRERGPAPAAARSAPAMNALQWALASGGSLVGALLLALLAFQERLLYHPDEPGRAYPELPPAYALPYEDVELVAADGTRLHAWLILQPAGAARRGATVAYFHGNAGNIAHRLQDVRQFYLSGFNVLVVSYRGYGRSEGKPSERGFKMDAAAAIDYAVDRGDVLDPAKLFLFGRSIGGAVVLAAAATEAKAGDRVKGVIVENTFTSIGDMIDVVLPPLRFVKALNRNKWDSLSVIKDLETPILFISGLRDELVPPPHVKQLHDDAVRCRIKHFYVVEDGSHNDTWYRGGSLYRQAIRSFVDTVLASPLAARAAVTDTGAPSFGEYEPATDTKSEGDSTSEESISSVEPAEEL